MPISDTTLSVVRVISSASRVPVSASTAPVTMAMDPNLPSLRFVCFRGPDDEVLELIERPAS